MFPGQEKWKVLPRGRLRSTQREYNEDFIKYACKHHLTRLNRFSVRYCLCIIIVFLKIVIISACFSLCSVSSLRSSSLRLSCLVSSLTYRSNKCLPGYRCDLCLCSVQATSRAVFTRMGPSTSSGTCGTMNVSGSVTVIATYSTTVKAGELASRLTEPSIKQHFKSFP